MTPAEWLALIMLVSTGIGIVRDVLDPDAITIKFRDGFWLAYFVVLAVVQLVLALVVLL